MDGENRQHRTILARIADQDMVEAGLLPDFSRQALAELKQINAAATAGPQAAKDLRGLGWCSIDNDDSLDLDQLTVAEALPGGQARFLVAIADVDALVKEGSAINEHARHNTTSIYTAGKIYPMLPEKLSTGLTSLNLDQDRLALVVEMVIGADGTLASSEVYRAQVRNKAKLAYGSVAAWFEGHGAIPSPIPGVPGLDDNLRLQDRIAQRLKQDRQSQGALTLETVESRAVFDQDQLTALEVEQKNRAKDLIENFMVAANGVTARFLSARDLPSIRRVVRVPRRWDRIVEIAAEKGVHLPAVPDSSSLESFLSRQQAADPQEFPDLSLTVIKLLGSGEYVADPPGGQPPGHFGLAVKDYSHSTAPNRRYPDLLTQRLLKAALEHRPAPYDMDQLEQLAQHCTEAEDTATKVERRVEKSAAALLLQHRIGQEFSGICTGAADKGTWVRLFSLPVEGKLVSGARGVDVGDRVRVRLIHTDVEAGYIDFALVAIVRHAGGRPATG